jgi:hypothetical protein
LVEREAGDAAARELLEPGVGSLHAEGALELGQGGVAEAGRIRAPGVSEDATDDPVGTADDSIKRGVVGIDEQVGEPAVAAAEGERVSIEQHDAGHVVRRSETGGRGDACAERVADDYGTHDVEALLEASKKLEPVRHRVGAAPLAVAEGRQVKGKDAMAVAGEERAYVVPDPGRLGGPAQEDDR